jgi:hypothetical protein
MRGEPHTACGYKGVDRRQDGVCSHLPCVCRDDDVIGPSHVVERVHPAMPVPPVHHACEAVEHPMTDDGRKGTAVWNPCRGRNNEAIGRRLQCEVERSALRGGCAQTGVGEATAVQRPPRPPLWAVSGSAPWA